MVVAPLFSRSNWIAFFSYSLQLQETKGKHHHTNVMMKASPRASLVVIQSQFVLHLLVSNLYRPTTLLHLYCLDGTRVRRKIAYRVLD